MTIGNGARESCYLREYVQNEAFVHFLNIFRTSVLCR